jgi:hypothetical protein
MSAIRKLGAEAADNGLLPPELAQGISRVKRVKSTGIRVGNWLSQRQAQALLSAPDITTIGGFAIAPFSAFFWVAGCDEARQPECEWKTGLTRLRQNASAGSEVQELCDALFDRIKLHTNEDAAMDDCPLFLHRQYMRDEVLVGLGLPQRVGARDTRTGRFWIEEIKTEVFFVTLDKSEKAFSPSTRYEDFAVSPTRFHWQSQSTTGENSPIGQRSVRQCEIGARFLLFVRPKRGNPFLFLGPLRYVSHAGSRLMSIYWDLEHPMPAWFFEICASLRAD